LADYHRSMFTVEQRDALRDRILDMARRDTRVVAGALVGSLALGDGDAFSDLDLTFGVQGDVALVLDDWTRTLARELGAVRLVDLARGPTTYRVFLFDDLLQFDLSMTPASEFRPAGLRFRLLFGETAPGVANVAPPPQAADVFGWGVIYALHSRTCIERGRLWQAEHYVGAVRDHAFTLACMREGAPAVQARGYDDLSAATLARFDPTHIGSLEPEKLRAALAATVRALVHEAREAGLANAEQVGRRITELG
jgi:hypothetical protein